MKIEEKYCQRNKFLNSYFDIKNLFKYSTKISYINSLTGAKKIKKLYSENLTEFKSNKKKIIKLNKISLPQIKKKLSKKEFKKFVKLYYFVKKNLKEYCSSFIVHGSYATNDTIPGWSDIDTFVIIKDEVLKSKFKILKFRSIIRKLYKLFKNICLYQHHGLILFSEKDLKNYLNKYIPIETLKYNIEFFDNSKIEIFFQKKNKKNHYIDYLKDRHTYFLDALKTGTFKHHPYKNKFLRIPIKANRKEMYQLFVLIGFFNNIPSYFFSAIGKSLNKKHSFVKFRKFYKNNFVNEFLIKGERVREQWNNKKNCDFIIPKWIVNILGEDYLYQGEKVLKNIILNLKKYENRRLHKS